MRIILPLLFSIFSFAAFSQDSTIALTRYEAFNLNSESILKTEIQELGTINLVTFDLVKTTNLASGQKFSAVKFFVGDRHRFNILSPNSFYISSDNLDTIIKVLQFFKAEMDKPVPTKNVHYSFKTNDNIQFTFYYDISYSGNWYFAINRMYHNPLITPPALQLTLIKKRIPELIYILERAREARL